MVDGRWGLGKGGGWHGGFPYLLPSTFYLLSYNPAPVNAPENIVVAQALSKAFDGHAAVRGIDLDIPRGGCFGILGPNGAGKTTTLRMILGQTHPTGGSLHVLGLPMPESVREVRRRGSEHVAPVERRGRRPRPDRSP